MKRKGNMDRGQRAKQFMPFAALKGFEEELEQAEFRPVDKVEFSEDAAEELDRRLRAVKTGDMVEVIFYRQTKKGGTYLRKTGLIAGIDPVERTLTVVKTVIPFSDLYSIVLLKGL